MANSKNCFLLLLRGAVVLALILGITSITTQGSRIPAASPQTKTHIYVTVSPSTANVEVGSSRSFAATVHNDSLNKGVKWTLSGPGKLSATFSKSGQAIEYTAPSTVPNPATVILTATSVANNTKSVSATITVKPVPPPTPTNLGALQDPRIVVDLHNHIGIAALSADSARVVFRHSVDGGRTFSNITVATSATPLAGLQIALDAQRHITLLWEDWQTQRAFVSVSIDGVSFSTPAIVPGAGINCGLGPCSNDRGIYPHLSVTPGGAINVAYIGTPGDPQVDVISKVSVDNGAHFSAGTDFSFAATSVTSAAGPQDQDYLIWSSPDGTVNLSASLDSGKTFGPLLNIMIGGAPYAVVDSSGNIAVMSNSFDQNTATHTLSFTRSTDQGKTFSAPVVVATTSEFVTPDAERLAVEADGAIDVVFVADRASGGADGDVQFARSVDHGATFSTPSTLAPGGFPDIGLDSCGGINVAWDNLVDIFLTRSTNGKTFSTPVNLTHLSTTVAFRPQIAADSRGNTYLVWTESSPSGSASSFFLVAAQHGTTCKQ
jgi:hypothetical protein